eukprot:12900882-Prorocentrum_lima.AAC.1
MPAAVPFAQPQQPLQPQLLIGPIATTPTPAAAPKAPAPKAPAAAPGALAGASEAASSMEQSWHDVTMQEAMAAKRPHG